MKSMLKSKKGIMEKAVEELPDIILTVIVIFGVYALLSFFANPVVESQKTQSEVFVYRMLYQPNVISYTEKNGRVYPGIIDEKLFNDEHINEMIVYSDERKLSAKITITDSFSGKEFISYYHKDWYERLEPVSRTSWTGLGGVKVFKKTMQVIYRKNGIDIPSEIKFEIIIPNS